MTSTTKLALFYLIIGAVLATGLRAQGTYTAASCNESDVSAAVAAEQAKAADGDIISIPSGTCTWTGNTGITINATNSLTIQGAGAQYATTGGASTAGSDSTVIIDNIDHAASNSPTFNFNNTAAGKSYRLTGIFIQQNGSSYVNNNGVVGVSGNSSAVRIDHCHFYGTHGDSFVATVGNVTGVADHDFFQAQAGLLFFFFEFQNGSSWKGANNDGLGDASFADASHWGTSQFFYAEDSYFHYGDYVTDCEDGGRFVIRYSTIVDAALAWHGTAGSQGRGCRAGEIYGNTFTYPDSGPSNAAVAVNSGTVLVWGNTVSNNTNVVLTGDLRDSNGTYSEPAPPNGWGYCGTAQTGSVSSWDQNTDSSGYACLDQPGRGAGDLITGTAFPNIVNSVLGGQAWPREAIDPIYIWDNTYNLTGAGKIWGNLTGALVTDNRDVYQQFGTYGESGSFSGAKGIGQGTYSQISSSCTAGPGGNTPGVGFWATDQSTLYVCNPTNTWKAYYTPYTYPHPLTGGSSDPLVPPTNVKAVGH